MNRKAAKELLHIQSWLIRVDQIAKRGKEEYVADALLQEAGDSLMMKLGEAANRLSRLGVLAPDGVEWVIAVANRNFIIHQYDEINRELTWVTLSIDLPGWVARLAGCADRRGSGCPGHGSRVANAIRRFRESAVGLEQGQRWDWRSHSGRPGWQLPRHVAAVLERSGNGSATYRNSLAEDEDSIRRWSCRMLTRRLEDADRPARVFPVALEMPISETLPPHQAGRGRRPIQVLRTTLRVHRCADDEEAARFQHSDNPREDHGQGSVGQKRWNVSGHEHQIVSGGQTGLAQGRRRDLLRAETTKPCGIETVRGDLQDHRGGVDAEGQVATAA